uniref:C6 zinc finger domain-containing protein n=1 Tax=Ganoderma boninense TaxID=34458 RepID=A0A5K1JWA9_9APHY|nr:C6 zinc finger domain-containing protein [Ganoderma boninense]
MPHQLVFVLPVAVATGPTHNVAIIVALAEHSAGDVAPAVMVHILYLPISNTTSPTLPVLAASIAEVVGRQYVSAFALGPLPIQPLHVVHGLLVQNVSGVGVEPLGDAVEFVLVSLNATVPHVEVTSGTVPPILLVPAIHFPESSIGSAFDPVVHLPLLAIATLPAVAIALVMATTLPLDLPAFPAFLDPVAFPGASIPLVSAARGTSGTTSVYVAFAVPVSPAQEVTPFILAHVANISAPPLLVLVNRYPNASGLIHGVPAVSVGGQPGVHLISLFHGRPVVLYPVALTAYASSCLPIVADVRTITSTYVSSTTPYVRMTVVHRSNVGASPFVVSEFRVSASAFHNGAFISAYTAPFVFSLRVPSGTTTTTTAVGFFGLVCLMPAAVASNDHAMDIDEVDYPMVDDIMPTGV